MGKSTSTPPPAPDAGAIAKAQSDANLATAYQNAVLNRVNQVTPWGSTTYYAPGQYPPSGRATTLPAIDPSRMANNSLGPMVPPRAPDWPGSGDGYSAGGSGPGAPQFTDYGEVPTWIQDIAHGAVNAIGAGMGAPAGAIYDWLGAHDTFDIDNAIAQYQGNGQPDGDGFLGGTTKQRDWNFGGSGDDNPSGFQDTGSGEPHAQPRPPVQSTSVPGIFVRNGMVVDAQGQQVHDSRYESHGRPVDSLVVQPLGVAATGLPASGVPTGADDASTAGTFAPWTQVTRLDPAEQANLDQQRAVTNALLGLGRSQVGRIADTLARPLDFSGLPQAPTLDYGVLGAVPTLSYAGLAPQASLDYGGLPALPNAGTLDPNDPVVQTLYGAATSRLDPRFADQRAALEQRLADQGINVQSNGAAYDRAARSFDQARNDAYQQAMAQAMAAGLSAQQNRFNQQLALRQQAQQEATTRYQAATAARAQAQSELNQLYQAQMAARQQAEAEINARYQAGVASRQQAEQELLALRNQPINELAALLGAAPGVSAPPIPGVAGINVPGVNVGTPAIDAYNSQLKAYQAQQQAQNDFANNVLKAGTGIFGPGGAWGSIAPMFSSLLGR